MPVIPVKKQNSYEKKVNSITKVDIDIDIMN